MRAWFLDCEASSLGSYSYPIEVGWVDQDGQGESHLIRPAPAWFDWSAEAECIHGISRQQLIDEGRDHNWVANRLIEVMTQPSTPIYSDAPGWDQAWTNELLIASGHRAGQVRLCDISDAYVLACLPLESAGLAGYDLARNVRAIVAAAHEGEAPRLSPRHRALADAMSLWRTWREVRDRAEALAARHARVAK